MGQNPLQINITSFIVCPPSQMSVWWAFSYLCLSIRMHTMMRQLMVGYCFTNCNLNWFHSSLSLRNHVSNDQNYHIIHRYWDGRKPPSHWLVVSHWEYTEISSSSTITHTHTHKALQNKCVVLLIALLFTKLTTQKMIIQVHPYLDFAFSFLPSLTENFPRKYAL